MIIMHAGRFIARYHRYLMAKWTPGAQAWWFVEADDELVSGNHRQDEALQK